MRRRFTPTLYEPFEALLSMSDIGTRVEKRSSRLDARVHILTAIAVVESTAKRTLLFDRQS
jgi:hypothetical protein